MKQTHKTIEYEWLTYLLMVLWLQLARQIPAHQTEAAILITTAFNRKPNLPALKDEMRKAGVV